MAIIHQPLEIRRADGAPSGKYRMVRYSDEDECVPHVGLCEHEHNTMAEASACPDARTELDSSMMTGADRPDHSSADRRATELLKLLSSNGEGIRAPTSCLIITRALRDAEAQGREDENKACTEKLRECLDPMITEGRTLRDEEHGTFYVAGYTEALQRVRVKMLGEPLE